MVWTAIWGCKRSCLAGELTVRYKRKVGVDQTLRLISKIIRIHPRLVETECRIDGPGGDLIAMAMAKYVPLTSDETHDFLRTLVDEPQTAEAAGMLKKMR